MAKAITIECLGSYDRSLGRKLLLTVVATASLGISPLASQPFGSGTVSFVNVDTAAIDLVITDNVNKDNKKTFHLGVGKETPTFKVSGDSKLGGKSNFNWKATREDAGKKLAKCKTVTQPIRDGSYGRIDVAAGKEKIGEACR
jgi:hypothetical protein